MLQTAESYNPLDIVMKQFLGTDVLAPVATGLHGVEANCTCDTDDCQCDGDECVN